MGIDRVLGLTAVAIAAVGITSGAFAEDCSARIEGSPAGTFGILCSDGAEIRIGEGFVTLPPECNFVDKDDPSIPVVDPTNPAYVVIQQFDFFKVGVANDGLGGADNWKVSQGRASGSTIYTCQP